MFPSYPNTTVKCFKNKKGPCLIWYRFNVLEDFYELFDPSHILVSLFFYWEFVCVYNLVH